MWPGESRKPPVADIESGALYPGMMESPAMRWAFIRKVYTILSLQMLMTVAVASVIVFVHPVATFFRKTGVGLGLSILFIILPLIVICPLYYFANKHPVNYFLLAIFTASLSFLVGLSSAYIKGRVVLEAAILTSLVFISLTLYTFWAAKKGKDFSFLGPFLFSALLILVVFSLIQIFFPMGKIARTVFAGLSAIVFSGYIIYDTDNIIKRYTYDDFIWAVVALYLDVVNLFLALLTLLGDS